MVKPRLLILSFSPIVSDARVLKQVRLFSDDYAVSTCGYGPAPDGVEEHFEVPANMPAWRYSRPLVIARQYRRAYWANAAIRFARTALQGREFDIVLADDVESVGLALALTPRAGVHADLHEYAPKLHEESWKFRWFVAPFFAWMTRLFVSRADSWSTVGGGLAREYHRRFGFDPVVVTNAAPFREAEPTAVHEPLRLVHSGAGLRNRNLDVMMRGAMASDTGCTLDLYLTENDPSCIADLRALSASSSGRVRVLDPVPYEQLADTLATYDVGVFVLPPVTFNYRWALPNKFFDYVQARLGIIIGPSPEMEEYVRRNDLGAVASDFSPEALTDVLNAITTDDVVRWKGSSARHARALSSESEVAKWGTAIDALAARLQP